MLEDVRLARCELDHTRRIKMSLASAARLRAETAKMAAHTRGRYVGKARLEEDAL